MTRRVYVYFLATFALGAILGGVGVYYYYWYTGRLLHHTGFDKDRAVAHLRKELNLSDLQAQQIGQIFDDQAVKVRDLQQQLEPQFQAVHQETRARIRQVLNPHQQKKFDEFVKAIDARHGRRAPPAPSR